jgi:DNA repair exonuclease SbcCD ATPase subunit
LKEANVNLRAEMEELRSETQREQAARRHAIGTLETKLAEVTQSLTDKEAELRALQASEGESAEALKVAEMTVQSLRAEVDGLRKEIRTTQADRDTQFAAVVQRTDQLHSVQGFLQNFKERNLQLASQISDYKRVMDKMGWTPTMNVDGIPPKLDGIVTAVGERNLIEISLGSDDGLRVGHRLEVFRSNAYLGYAVVLKTDPDRAVAQIDEKTQRGLVKVRDRVATKLSRTRTG